MADKEATVYIVDVGKSMGKKNQGRGQTDLDWALQYVWDKITTTVWMIYFFCDLLRFVFNRASLSFSFALHWLRSLSHFTGFVLNC